MDYNRMNNLRKITFKIFTLLVGIVTVSLILELVYFAFPLQEKTFSTVTVHLFLLSSFILAVSFGFIIRYIDKKLIMLPRVGKGKELKDYILKEFGINITPEQEEKIKIYVLEAFGIYGRKK